MFLLNGYLQKNPDDIEAKSWLEKLRSLPEDLPCTE